MTIHAQTHSHDQDPFQNKKGQKKTVTQQHRTENRAEQNKKKKNEQRNEKWRE